MSILKPHRRIMVETLLNSGATHREIERRTGVDRKTTWRAASAAAADSSDAPTPARNRRKHGVGFEEAITAFADPLSLTLPDPDHSAATDVRYILIGLSDRGRLLVMSHAERGTVIRLISARATTRRERVQYEEEE